MEMMAVATLTLIAGTIDDLRSRKVHNALILAMLPMVIIFSLYFRGFEGTLFGAGSLFAALVVTMPLFALGILGGGDVKLFALFSFCLDPVSMFWTLVYSIIWGALFGVTRAALQKNLLSLVRNTYKASQQKVETPTLHKMPYTFSLLLGWFTQLTLLHAGGLL